MKTKTHPTGRPVVYSKSLRFWHWTTLLITGLILFTVFVDKTFLNRWNTAPVIATELKKQGVNLSNDQAFRLGSDLGVRVWDWHIKYGYVLSSLFVFRVILEFFQPAEQKIRRKLKRPATLIYLLFYGLLCTILSTGIWMAYHRPPTDEALYHNAKTIHETCFNFIILFIFIHLVGVVRAEQKQHQHIVSKMITGGDQ